LNGQPSVGLHLKGDVGDLDWYLNRWGCRDAAGEGVDGAREGAGLGVAGGRGGSCALGCLCLRLFCSVARTSHKSYGSAVGWTLLSGWARVSGSGSESGSGSGVSVICANRLKAEREVRDRLVLGRACWLNGGVGFAAGGTSGEPTDHSALGFCRRSELAARRGGKCDHPPSWRNRF
jgi:hypothetical protein